MLNDPHVFEGLLLQLLYDLSASDAVKPLLKAIELVGFDLNLLMPRMFTAVLRKLHYNKSFYAQGKNLDKDKYPQLTLIKQILDHERLLKALLTSQSLF